MPELIMRSLPMVLRPDPSRTVLRPFHPEDPPAFAVKGHPRAERIIQRVLSLDDARVATAIDTIIKPIRARHGYADEVLLSRYDQITKLTDARGVSRDRALLIGACFTEEFAFEAAALFNPSIVAHPDQSGLEADTVRFLMSLRGIGEGHVSSVTFRVGRWNINGSITIDLPGRHGVAPRTVALESENPVEGVAELDFRHVEMSEPVLFPVLPSQARGIEDLRLVRFIEEDGSASYVGTYTAFDGYKVRQELLRASENLRSVQMRSLRGDHMDTKGMALFPRRIDGQYLAVGRQDNENIWLRHSDDLISWREGPKILVPRSEWEIVQIGNCGSPLELDEGWLLLTHGVGLVRNYCIGAALLDKSNPTKVLARTSVPLLWPQKDVRGGYVPNVVYSCGGLVHNGVLLLPYGVADLFTAFATVPIADLLGAMN